MEEILIKQLGILRNRYYLNQKKDVNILIAKWQISFMR